MCRKQFEAKNDENMMESHAIKDEFVSSLFQKYDSDILLEFNFFFTAGRRRCAGDSKVGA